LGLEGFSAVEIYGVDLWLRPAKVRRWLPTFRMNFMFPSSEENGVMTRNNIRWCS